MHVGWIDGGVLIVPQSTQRPPRRPSISSAPRTNIALSGGTPIGMVSPAASSWPRARSASVYVIGAPGASASITRAAPATGVSTSINTPVVRPPPVPTIATRPGASSAPIAPSNGAAAPVSPTAPYTAVDAGAPPPTSLATVAPRRPSGSGSDHVRTSNDASAVGHLRDDRQEDLLAEQARVVEVADVVLAVAPVAVEERTAPRHARADRRRAAGRGEHDRRGTGAATRFEPGAGPGPAGVGRDDERDVRRTRADGVGRGGQRVHARVRRPGGERAADVVRATERGREDREARAVRERRAGRAPEDGVDVRGVDAGRVERGGARLPGERQHVFVGRADGRGAASALAAPRGGDVSRRQPPARRGRAHSQQSNRHLRSRWSGRRVR